MSFWDSVSQALGTDGSNNGLLPGLSNVLGTDGSKNGLLNDPVSMAALAIGGAAYLGYIPTGASAAAGGNVASTAAAAEAAAAYAGETALTDLVIVQPLGSSAVASVTASQAASAWSLPSWLTTSNVLGGLSTASKLMGSGKASQGAQPMYGMYYAQPNNNSNNKLSQRALSAPQAEAQAGAPWLLVAVVAAIALSKMK